jgi:hypothetical protein
MFMLMFMLLVSLLLLPPMPKLSSPARVANLLSGSWPKQDAGFLLVAVKRAERAGVC